MKKDAAFYCLDYIESSMIPHSMLHKIIQKLKTKQNNSLTLAEKAYLQHKGLNTLYQFVEGSLSFNQYKKESINDKNIYKKRLEDEQLQLEKLKELERIKEQKRLEKLAQEKILKQKLEAERRKKLESDPKYIAQQREKALFKKYDIYHYIDKEKRLKLLNILSMLDNQQRLQESEAIWLHSDGKDFFTEKVKLKFHRTEANFYIQQYKITNSAWHAINASSQLRKCRASREAEKFLENTRISLSKNTKLLLAYFTTLGGVKRDLNKSNTAIAYGLNAHDHSFQDYRPYTLLGAICMENHEYDFGHEWYSKARDRGAPENSINAELKSILLRLDKIKRNKMITSLLKKDSYLYGWLKNIKQ